MASYAFATLQARQALQELWEQGKTVKDMAVALDVPLSTLYTELRRGRSGVRLPDQRLQYDASLAQLRMQQELERRGKAKPLRYIPAPPLFTTFKGGTP